MTIDGYTIESYITNLSIEEKKVPYDSLTEDQKKLEAEQRIIHQMVKAVGCEITSMERIDMIND